MYVKRGNSFNEVLKSGISDKKNKANIKHIKEIQKQYLKVISLAQRQLEYISKDLVKTTQI